jgi:hypothetical protein
MSREEKVQIVYWCNTCKLTSLVINAMQTCAFCQGELKEIGWVEK